MSDSEIINIRIGQTTYRLNLASGTVWSYKFSRGSDESGDFEGWEPVGNIVGMENKTQESPTIKIADVKRVSLERLQNAISDLEKMTDANAIEGHLAFIRFMVTEQYRRAHLANSIPGEWHDPDCLAMNP